MTDEFGSHSWICFSAVGGGYRAVPSSLWIRSKTERDQRLGIPLCFLAHS